MASLLRRRRFLPLFVAQSLGAFNDNLAKTALAMLVLYGGSGRGWLVPASAASFVAPYALFGALAGGISDRDSKTRLLRLTKLTELALMLGFAAALLARAELALLGLLFLLGVQATFFGPLKYGLLPELLAEDELLRGNGLTEAGTFFAILAGTQIGAWVTPRVGGPAMVAGLLVAAGGIGLAAAGLVPGRPAAAPDLALAWHPVRALRDLLATARGARAAWRSALAISWFWALGLVFLSEFPLLGRQVFGADSGVAAVMLGAFTVGIGAGSALAGRLRARPASGGRMAATSLAVMGAATLGFAGLAATITPATGLTSLGALLTAPRGWALLALLALVAGAGGTYSVPLYARLQWAAPRRARARLVAANNVLNAGAMVGASCVLAGLTALGATPPLVLMGFGAASLGLVAVLWRDAGLNTAAGAG